MWLPDADDVIQIHDALVALFQSSGDPIFPPGVKSRALLESACGRPHTGIGSVQKYKTVEQKAAALFHSLTKNHSFHNGNKRTALVALLTVLDRNDRRLSTNITDDELYDFVIAVTTDHFPRYNHNLDVDHVVAEISYWIRANGERKTVKVRSMRVPDFIAKCREAGATIKDGRGGAVIISKGIRSIRVGKDTPHLDGPVIKRWLKVLGISEQSGIGIDDFAEGAFEARDQIQRFIRTLRRLAKT